jgi:hypothetical protein
MSSNGTMCGVQCVVFGFYQVVTFPLRLGIAILQFQINFRQVIFGQPVTPFPPAFG